MFALVNFSFLCMHVDAPDRATGNYIKDNFNIRFGGLLEVFARRDFTLDDLTKQSLNGGAFMGVTLVSSNKCRRNSGLR